METETMKAPRQLKPLLGLMSAVCLLCSCGDGLEQEGLVLEEPDDHVPQEVAPPLAREESEASHHILSQTILMQGGQDEVLQRVKATFHYNEHQRLVKEEWDLDERYYRVQYIYGAFGRLKRRVLQHGYYADPPEMDSEGIIEYEHDATGELVRELWFHLTERGYQAFRELNYSYDLTGHILTITVFGIEEDVRINSGLIVNYYYPRDGYYQVSYRTMEDGDLILSEEVESNEKGQEENVFARTESDGWGSIAWFFGFHPTYFIAGDTVFLARGVGPQQAEWGLELVRSNLGHKEIHYNQHGDVSIVEVFYEEDSSSADAIWEFYYEYSE